MSGILDKKSRVLDSIITLEGRKQLSNGGINIRYVTFTDGATFYKADMDNGSADATLRLYLESCHLPQDEITFQSDDDGKLVSFKSSLDKLIKDGKLLNTDVILPSDSEMLSGSSIFVSTQERGTFLQQSAESLLTSSIDNLKKMQIIGTKDSLFDDNDFSIGSTDVEFVITETGPIPIDFGVITDVRQLENIIADPRFSNLVNFKYLPPINKTDEIVNKSNVDNLSKYLLGSYPAWNSIPSRVLSHREVINEHAYYARNGFSKILNFDPTSYSNNLFFQAFEVTNDTMYKLDIIDFGINQSVVRQSEDTRFSPGPITNIFFIGRLITKSETNTHSFVHLFTLIFG
jgi:hypothetical protein